MSGIMDERPEMDSGRRRRNLARIYQRCRRVNAGAAIGITSNHVTISVRNSRAIKSMTPAGIKQLVWASTLVAALSTGLMAGVFFAFSTFVMKALARLPIPQGIQAMQAINLTAVTPVFMAALFGSTAVCLLLAAYSLASWPQQAAFYLLLGSLLYLVGSFLTTVLFNVPLNNALARVDPGSVDGARLWARYLTSWTAWNHVRTVSSILASAAYAFALSRWSR